MQQESGRRRLIWAARVVVVLVVLGALAAGYYGLWLYVPTRAGLGDRPWDLFYYDLQLFTLGSDAVQQGPPFNPWLEVARFALPVLALSAVSAVVARILNASLRRLARGHVIVVGKGGEADTITAVLGDQAPRQGVLRRRRKVFQIPNGDEKALRSAGVRNASRLVVCGTDSGDTAARAGGGGDDNAANLTAANVVLRLRHRRGLVVTILVSDADLALALRARRLAKTGQHDLPVRVFTMDELAARNHMRNTSLDAEAPHVLVVGGTPFGRAIIIEYALRRRREGPDLPPVPVTLLDEQAESIIRGIRERFPYVERVLTLTPLAQTLTQTLRELDRPPTRMYFCSDDESLALGQALAAAGHWQPTQRSIVVRLNRLRTHSQAFRGGADLFDDLGNALDFVTVPESATEELEAFDDPILELACSLHEQFLHDSVSRGQAVGLTPSMVPWEQLPANYRRDNLDLARGLPAKLATIRATVAPRSGLIDEFVFTDDEVEMLAIAEHQRWCKEKRAAGWTAGPMRDLRRKTNPMLVAWEQLGKEGRDKNRDIIRGIPLDYGSSLAVQGMQIIRLSPDPNASVVPRILDDELSAEQIEELAKAIHAAFLEQDPAPTGPAVVPWDQLDETFRQACRGQARDMGRKLELIKTSVTRTPPPEAFQFSEDEVEMLAPREHRRWMDERKAAGWRYGTRRDVTLKTNPDMVAWAGLSETERNKDRNAVRAIPDLLRPLGLHIVRRLPSDR